MPVKKAVKKKVDKGLSMSWHGDVNKKFEELTAGFPGSVKLVDVEPDWKGIAYELAEIISEVFLFSDQAFLGDTGNLPFKRFIRKKEIQLGKHFVNRNDRMIHIDEAKQRDEAQKILMTRLAKI